MAHDIENYTIGKGICSIKLDSESIFRDIGNCPQFEFTPEIEELEHFSSREGISTVDKTVVKSKKGTLKITFEEKTTENLMLALLGTTNTDGSIEIFGQNAVACAVKFEDTHEVGQNLYTWQFDRVDIIPASAVQLISEDWWAVELTGRVGRDETTGFGTVTVAT